MLVLIRMSHTAGCGRTEATRQDKLPYKTSAPKTNVDGLMCTPKLNAEVTYLWGNAVPFLSIPEKYPTSTLSNGQRTSSGERHRESQKGVWLCPGHVNSLWSLWRTIQESLGAQGAIHSAPRQTLKAWLRGHITGTQSSRASLTPFLVLTRTVSIICT